MTPKEKATEIVKRFIGYNSIPCALIVVDQVIEALSTTTGHVTLSKLDVNEVNKDKEFWNQVRKEIKKI